MPKVFISRELSPDSVFLQKLVAAGYEVIGKSLVQFSSVSFTTLPDTDWIFFYSKTAVGFFFETSRKADLPINAQLAALGEGTAKAIEKQGFQTNFTGNGEPSATAKAFLNIAKGKRVLFPRAANSRQSIQQLLENQIIVIDLIVYQNEPRTDFALPICQWLVFTSPLNAEAYFQRYPLQANQKILAIGETTAQTLRKLKLINPYISDSPSEEALANIILEE